MLNDLKDKVVLITGSSTGIGAAAAVAFGKLGARVAVHYNSSKGPGEEVLQAVKATGAQAILLQGNVLETAQCHRLVEETVKAFGRIDILINNAGALVQRVPIEEITDELFDNVVHLNVRSAMVCSAADTMFDSGALATMTPRRVADSTSTLSNPTPARPTTMSESAAARSASSTCVAERTMSACAPLMAECSCSGDKPV
jgi:NAD(P)-dependent dehydrogenase (short-subunit alcohol dehydrogenase family)